MFFHLYKYTQFRVKCGSELYKRVVGKQKNVLF